MEQQRRSAQSPSTRTFYCREDSREKSSRWASAKDPVCDMMADEKKTKLSSKHGDKTFYFCSASCSTTFDKDSHRYGHQ